MSSSASTTGRSAGSEPAACAQAKTPVRKSSATQRGEAESRAGVSPAPSNILPALEYSRANGHGGRRDACPTLRVEFILKPAEHCEPTTSVRAQKKPISSAGERAPP